MNGFEKYYEKFAVQFLPDTLEGRERITELEELIDEFSPLPAGAKVLDLGCGGGISTIALARRGYEVVGIDIVPSLVQVCERATAEYLNVSVALADARQMPFEDNYFDAVFVLANPFPHWNIHHFRKIANEIWRVLSDGGTAFFDFADFILLKISQQFREIEIDNSSEEPFIFVESKFDSANGSIKRKYLFPKTGEYFELDYYLWSEFILKFILKLVGFSEIECCRTDAEFPRKMCIARKLHRRQ
ncbi:class I SAM-dependent methyltransferase [bacterium]|nr:class I SAM-dependent methyltransferase [bacterium]